MRVLGYWFGPGGDGPVDRAWLPFGDLTVLMGANDSGKSRLLRRLERDLNALEALHAGVAAPNALLYLELEEAELESVVEATAHQWEDSEQEPTTEPLSPANLRRKLPERFVSHPGVTEAIGLLESSRTIAVEAWSEPTPQGPRPCLLLHWCAPPLAELDPELRASVEAFVREGRPPDDDLDARAPTLISRIGTIEAPFLPAPVRLPVDEVELVQEVAEAVTQFVTVLWIFDRLEAGDENFARWIDDGQGLRLLEKPPGSFEFWLVEPEPHSVRVHEDTRLAFELVTRAANSARVPFLEARYQLSVAPTPVWTWAAGPAVEVSLLSHDPPTADESESPPRAGAFPLAQAAEGLRLWVQFAVAEGLDALRTTTSHLLNTVPMAVGDVLYGDDHGVAEWIALLREQRDLPPELGDASPLPLEEQMAWWNRAVVLGGEPLAPRALRAVRPPLYLVDEPERHLNPRLTREAARWLEDWLSRHRSQAIVISHSVAFLGAGESSRYALVERTAEAASLVPFDPDELSAMTAIAQSLGLDHGELLGLTRLLLFVEGLGDRAVLEALFGPRLRRAGIVVVPISGTRNHPVIVEGDVLLRYCAHRAAVVFDSLDAECIRRLRHDLDFRSEVYRTSKSTECKNMAQLLDAAAREGRDLTPLPLDAPDMFDLLDDDVLRELFPTWPGHAEAQLAYGLAKPRDRRYWTYLRTEYGAEKKVAVLAEVGAKMRELGRIPTVLQALVSKAERIADGVEPI